MIAARFRLALGPMGPNRAGFGSWELFPQGRAFISKPGGTTLPGPAKTSVALLFAADPVAVFAAAGGRAARGRRGDVLAWHPAVGRTRALKARRTAHRGNARLDLRFLVSGAPPGAAGPGVLPSAIGAGDDAGRGRFAARLGQAAAGGAGAGLVHLPSRAAGRPAGVIAPRGVANAGRRRAGPRPKALYMAAQLCDEDGPDPDSGAPDDGIRLGEARLSRFAQVA